MLPLLLLALAQAIAFPDELQPESDSNLMVEFEPCLRIGLIKFESLVAKLELLAGRRVDIANWQILWDAAMDDVSKVHRKILNILEIEVPRPDPGPRMC
jgi:predicted nucleotidyltransferase